MIQTVEKTLSDGSFHIKQSQCKLYTPRSVVKSRRVASSHLFITYNFNIWRGDDSEMLTNTVPALIIYLS